MTFQCYAKPLPLWMLSFFLTFCIQTFPRPCIQVWYQCHKTDILWQCCSGACYFINSDKCVQIQDLIQRWVWSGVVILEFLTSIQYCETWWYLLPCSISQWKTDTTLRAWNLRFWKQDAYNTVWVYCMQVKHNRINDNLPLEEVGLCGH